MRFGEKWHDQFEEDCKVEMKREEEVEQFIKKNEKIKKLIPSTDTSSFPDFDLIHIDQTTKYYAMIRKYYLETHDISQDVPFAKMIVDYKTGEINFISDKIENIKTNN